MANDFMKAAQLSRTVRRKGRGWQSAAMQGSVLGLDCHHSVIKQMVFVWWLARCGVEPHSELRSRRDLKAVIIEESPGVLEYKRGVRFIDIIDKLWEEQMPFERFPRVPNQC